MDFNTKNFRYTTMLFGDFVKEVKQGKRMYLRALSPEAPAEQAANLERDFPVLAADFSLPQELTMCADNIHSSVLRISGPVNMWLHYGTFWYPTCTRMSTDGSSTVVLDVQANVYCQIHGSKRMLLFPPPDVVHLAFAPGASSSSIDVFGSLGSPALASTHPWEVNLDPGDVLFIPPLVSHIPAIFCLSHHSLAGAQKHRRRCFQSHFFLFAALPHQCIAAMTFRSPWRENVR